MKSSALGRWWQTKDCSQTQARGKTHPSPVVVELSKDVGDVGSPSGSRKHPLRKSVPQFLHSVYEISGRGSSE